MTRETADLGEIPVGTLLRVISTSTRFRQGSLVRVREPSGKAGFVRAYDPETESSEPTGNSDGNYRSSFEIVEERKFSSGDKIVYTGMGGISAQPGATATVDDPAYKGEYLRVIWDRDEKSGNQSDGSYYESTFNLISGEKTMNVTTDATTSEVKFKNRLIMRPVNKTIALILIDARANFTGEDHEALDAIITQVRSAGVSLRYVAKFNEFLNPEARFAEFMGMTVEDALKMNADFGIGLTDDQVNGIITLQAITKGKFADTFKPIVLPYPLAEERSRLLLEGSENRDNALLWIKGDPLVSQQPLRRAIGDSERDNLLRIVPAIGSTVAKVELLSDGYSTSVKRFQIMAEKALRYWADAKTNSASLKIGSEQNYDCYVYPRYIKLGCQYIPRSQVERIAQELGMAFPNPTAE